MNGDSIPVTSESTVEQANADAATLSSPRPTAATTATVPTVPTVATVATEQPIPNTAVPSRSNLSTVVTATNSSSRPTFHEISQRLRSRDHTGNGRGLAGLAQEFSRYEADPRHKEMIQREVTSREQNQNISLLLRELESLKGQNNKLQESLQLTQRELAGFRIQQSSDSLAVTQVAPGGTSAIVEQIYRAQKDRDAAMMARLRMANQQRDEALDRLRSISPDRFRSTSPDRFRSTSPDRFRNTSPDRFRNTSPDRFRKAEELGNHSFNNVQMKNLLTNNGLTSSGFPASAVPTRDTGSSPAHASTDLLPHHYAISGSPSMQLPEQQQMTAATLAGRSATSPRPVGRYTGSVTEQLMEASVAKSFSSHKLRTSAQQSPRYEKPDVRSVLEALERAETADDVTIRASALSELVEGARHEQETVMRNGLREAQAQRDLALHKTKMLEEEVENLQVELKLKAQEHNMLTRTQLAALAQERDEALQKLAQLEDEKRQLLRKDAKECQVLQQQLELASGDRSALAEQLQQAKAAQRKAQADCHRFH